jgi:hypothetical protein
MRSMLICDNNPNRLGGGMDDTSLHEDLKLWPSTFVRKSGRQVSSACIAPRKSAHCCCLVDWIVAQRSLVYVVVVGKFLQIIIQAVAYIGSLAGLCVLLLLNKPKATPFALHKFFKNPLRRTQLQIEVSSSRVTGVCSKWLYFIVLINKTYIFP